MILRKALGVFMLVGALVTATLTEPFGSGNQSVAAEQREPIVMASANDYTCATDFSGEVQCWSGEVRVSTPEGLGKVLQMSAGQSHMCAIKIDTTIECWGELEPGISALVPERLKNRKGATQITGNCVAFDNRVIECMWGRDYKTASFEAPNIRQFVDTDEFLCVLDFSGRMYCNVFKGDKFDGWTPVLKGDDKALAIARSMEMVCALTDAGDVKCFDRPSDTPTKVEEGISSLAGGPNKFCGVKPGALPKCWSSERRAALVWTYDATRGTDNTLSLSLEKNSMCALLSKVEPDPSFSLITHDDYLRCDRQRPYIGPILELPLPTNLKVQVLEDGSPRFSWTANTRAGSFNDITHPAYGNFKYVVSNGKKTVCWDEGSSCVPDDNSYKIGDVLQFSLHGVNEVGITKTMLFPMFTYCPQNWELRFSSSKSVVETGTSAWFTGSLKNWCSKPKTFKTRTQAAGKSWSAWKTHTMPASLKFSFNEKVSVNTKVQVQVADKTQTVTTQPLNIQAAIKKSSTAQTITFVQSKTKQGFTQGGTFRVSFIGDNSYSGTCWLAARTNHAFNFAGTWMGREDKLVRYTVKKGRATASLNVRWNGKFEVVASCANPSYLDVVAKRVILLKMNF